MSEHLVPAVLDQVTITARDFAASHAFYDAALGSLGLVCLDELVDEEEDHAVVEAAAWGAPGGTARLWLITGSTPTTALHVRLQADSRQQVETFYAVSIEAGGVAHTAPRRWTIYRRGEFGATVGDPAGNLMEAVAAE